MTTSLRDEDRKNISIYLFRSRKIRNIHEMQIIDSVRHLIEYCSHTLNLASLQMTLKYEENKCVSQLQGKPNNPTNQPILL